MTIDPTADRAHLRDLKQDRDNARLHDERNLAAIETSLQTTGFGRPILAAKDGTVLAGNATLEAAGNIGMGDAILVHSDGTKPIIHVRTDLDPDSEMARLAAFYDNRTAELASWDTEVLAALMQETDIAPVAMTAGEAEALISRGDHDETPEEDIGPPAGDSGGSYREQYGVIVICANEIEQRDVYERLREEGFTVRVVTT